MSADPTVFGAQRIPPPPPTPPTCTDCGALILIARYHLCIPCIKAMELADLDAQLRQHRKRVREIQMDIADREALP
jgi:hypothetical protein